MITIALVDVSPSEEEVGRKEEGETVEDGVMDVVGGGGGRGGGEERNGVGLGCCRIFLSPPGSCLRLMIGG